MSPIPCPRCGELLECHEGSIGRTMRCPRCRTILRLEADGEGRTFYRRPRRFPLLQLALFLAMFLSGLAVGFQWGASAARPSGNGASATSVGFFGASSTIIVNDDKSAAGPRPGGR